jgi:8-oxo-dGTP diphosphatase / 2-hydroxy-dATP diphosphatase
MIPTKKYSLVFPRQAGQVLLGRKKRGFGEGKWNGFGGKVEAGESDYEGAVRELREECGLDASELCHCGSLIFEMHDKIMCVEVFEASTWEGLPVETEEMFPRWFSEDEIQDVMIHSSEMWPDDKFWLPLLLKGEKFRGKFTYAADDHTILENEVVILNTFT